MYKEKPKSLIWESPYDDDTEEEKMDREVEIWKKHYSSKHRILLVGEGDFSFSLCLARAFGSARNMVATTLDTQEDIARKYRKGIGNVRKLEERGCFVLHEVDVEQMSQHFFLRTQRFDRIVYNFPHVGFLFCENNYRQIQLNKRLVKSFLKNAKVLLQKEGEIHVAHKDGEPYSKWDFVGIAEETGLVLHDVVPFYKDDYRGYYNKRGNGSCPDAQFNLGDCSTYKFRLNHSPLLNFDEQEELVLSDAIVSQIDVGQLAEDFMEQFERQKTKRATRRPKFYS